MATLMSLFEKKFDLQSRRTNLTTEIIAGFTTFVTMAYILAVIPNILGVTGMDKDAIFLATCICTGIASILVGVFANLPIALAPGMGISAYFASIAMQQGGMPWQIALGAAFIASIIFFLLTITNVAKILVVAVPNSLKHAITVGIGFFITLIGLKTAQLVTLHLHLIPSSIATVTQAQGVAHPMFFEWDLVLGSLMNPHAALAIIGLLIMAALVIFQVKGAILFSIIITTLIGIPLGVTNVHAIDFTLPTFKNLHFGELSIQDAFSASLIPVIFTFVFVSTMDIFGTLISSANRAGLLDSEGKSPAISQAMCVGAATSTFATLLGIPVISAYLESMAGISVGGRTGLTAIVVGLMFFLAIFLGPIFKIIPAAAFAPALIVVGTFMVSSIKNIDFDDFTEALPAFLTIVFMPLTYNIGNGISMGILFYTVLKLVTGKWRKLHWMMYVLTALVLCKFLLFS